jgi:TRAP transporter TAXI family solute receptor
MGGATLQAAAGGAGGSWYVLLAGLVRLVAEIHPEIRIEVVEGGGVINHARVGTGELPLAILNPPMTRAALGGRAPYERAYPDLRVAVANLSVNHLHCVVEQALPVRTIAGWLEQRQPLRLPVDRVGTVDRMVFQLTLAHFGASEGDVARWGGALVPAENYDRQLALYSAREVNALWQFMAVPSPSIAAAHARRPLRALPFPDALVESLGRLGWTAAVLPPGAYGIVDASVPTVAMTTSLGVHASVPDDVVHAITEAICEHPARVRTIHPAAHDFDPARAHLEGPLHPGAARYFGQRGKLRA